MRRVLFLLVFLLIITALRAQPGSDNESYGLAFSSHEVSKDRRTALGLNPDKAFHIEKDFEINFDFSLQRLANAYGYILRIIANDTINIDLMSTPEHNEFQDLVLVINNTPTNIKFEFADVGLKPGQWTKINIALSFQKNEITLRWNDRVKTQSFDLKALHDFRFYFGGNDLKRYNTTDVPPMIIKDISLEVEKKLISKWLLKNHNTTEVYDSLSKQRAIAKNANWLIDRHTRWTHRKDLSIGRYPSIAFNSKSATLYVMDEHNLYSYNIDSERIVKKTVTGSAFCTDANQLFFDDQNGELLNYDVLTNKYQAFNFEGDRWPNSDTTYSEPNYWHNNKFYNSVDNTLYTFGGYGFFVYKNDFFKYDKSSSKWTSVQTSGSIPPRYLAAAGLYKSKNQVLIFGGYGSSSGKQELSPQSFYDLYSFDLSTHAIKKIRDYSPEVEDKVFSNSLIINETENCFYVLSYPKDKFQSQITLKRYALDTLDVTEFADAIPFQFHDEDSFCDLFYSKATNELVAVTVHKEKQHYQVEVYSISYPPLQVSDVLQTPQTKSTSAYYYIAFIILAIAGGVLAFIKVKGNKKTPTVLTEQPSIPSDSFSKINQGEETKLTSSILLFGGLQVFDKSGIDISAKFTMTLKELLALILVHSVRFDNGISATVIQEYLWPDKDEVSARNNRNVNIKKLRGLLEEISNITIENNNSYLKLTMDDKVFCDYQSVYAILNSNKQSQLSEQERIGFLIKNVKRGTLLPNLQVSWVDSFKSDISNQVIDTLLEYSQKLDANKDDKLLLEIADAVFTYDSINQEALVIKCSVLNKKGKYSLAKTWYDHFAKEYKNLYAENYPKSFEEVIS